MSDVIEAEIVRVDKDEKGRFLPGNAGNLAGRPKGARNRLTELFIHDLLKAWEDLGPEAIKKMAKKRPADFVRVVAMILPKQIEIKEGAFDGISNEQLAVIVAAARSALGIAGGGGSGTEEAGGHEPLGGTLPGDGAAP